MPWSSYCDGFIPWQIPILSEALDICLSKLHWAPTGHHVAVGDIEGKVHIYEAGEVSTSLVFTSIFLRPIFCRHSTLQLLMSG